MANKMILRQCSKNLRFRSDIAIVWPKWTIATGETDLNPPDTVLEKFERLSLARSKWTASDRRRETAQLTNR
jgi:hypothetical protein